MIAFRGGALALVGPANGLGFPLPIDSIAAYDWGPDPLPHVDGLSLPQAAFFRAEDENGVMQVWRLPADGSPPEAITEAEAGVSGFAVSHDSQRIAFSSGTKLFAQRLNGTAPVEIAALSSAGDAQPDFNPNGEEIAYVDNGIWTVPTAGGDRQQLIADDLTAGFERRYRQPRFAPNIDGLLVRVERSDITVPGVLDPNTGEVLEIAVEQSAHWLQDGRILLYGLTDGVRPGGLSIAGTGTLSQPAQFLPEILSVESAVEISTNQLRVVLPPQLVGPRTLRVASLDVSSGELAPLYSGGFLVATSLSSDGEFAAGYLYQAGDDLQGPLSFVNLQTGEQVVLNAPETVADFIWAKP